jgi:hypothetical protein
VPTELLRLTFSDLSALEREISANIRYGRVFVSEVIEAPVLTEGVLVLVHPLSGLELRLNAQVVMVNSEGPMRGTGIALRSFGPSDVERVQEFVQGAADSGEPAPAQAAEPRQRLPTPAPMPAASTERPRQVTPIPMPATLTDRPRRSTPEAARSEAVTVRPSAAPGAGRTVPPSAPENDWSDLHDSDFAHRSPAPPAPDPAPVALADETPAADGGDEAPIAEEPVARVAAPIAEDDWSDVAAAIQNPVEQEAETPAESTDVEPADAEHGMDAADSGDGTDAADAADAEEDSALDGESNLDADAPRPTELQQENRQQRLRTLNAVEQLKVARRGELADRIVIERLYGKQVWEALLQNPRITLPEVARIARKGTVPRPLIEQILENAQWTKEAAVRRALLSNPKLTGDGILKLLRMMPKHELKVMEKATAFPMSVRDAARKLLREGP